VGLVGRPSQEKADDELFQTDDSLVPAGLERLRERLLTFTMDIRLSVRATVTQTLCISSSPTHKSALIIVVRISYKCTD
jgi:hypothetical protein